MKNLTSNGDLLKAAIENDKNLKSYHLEMEMSQGETVLEITADVDAANTKYKLDRTMSTKSAKMGGCDIKIGDKLYSSRDNGPWRECSIMEVMLNEALINMLGMLKSEAVAQVQEKLEDGIPPIEQIAGVDTRHMSVSLQDLAIIGGGEISKDTGEGVADIWVSTGSNPTIRRLKITGKSGGEDRLVMITRSRIDEPLAVSIEAPELAPTPAP